MVLEQAWGAALLRITLGIIYFMHGYLAYAVLGPRAVTGYITRMGYPEALAPALAWYLIVAHLVGGALLVLGLWARIAAGVQLPIMFSALVLHHFDQGFFMKSVVVNAATGQTAAGGYEFVLLVLVATLTVMLLGAGALSFETTRDRRALESRPRR
jgi:putative oxidoreductase